MFVQRDVDKRSPDGPSEYWRGLDSPRRALLLTGFAWLSIAVIALRFTHAPVTTDVLAFLAAAVAGFLAHRIAGRSEQGTRAAASAGTAGPTAEADRMRAALLAA